MMTQESICREHREKNPETPTLTLARTIYKKDDNHLIFPNVESVRTVLRRIEGKAGEKDRKKMKDKSLFIEEARPLNPYALPESDEIKYEKYIIEPKGKLGIISDIHAPYHSMSALTKTIEYLQNEKIDRLLIDGDLFDFYGGSKFMKDPRKRRMHEEIEIACEVLRVLKKELNCEIILKLGNHCARFEHYLWAKVIEIPQLIDLQEIKDLTLKAVLEKRLDFKFGYVEDKDIMDFCGLTILHGHETGGGVFSPVSAARGLFTRAKASALCGHHHRTSEHIERTVNGDVIVNYSIGALCELSPNYLPINNWNHGFAVIEGEGTEYHVKNLKIINGKIY